MQETIAYACQADTQPRANQPTNHPDHPSPRPTGLAGWLAFYWHIQPRLIWVIGIEEGLHTSACLNCSVGRSFPERVERARGGLKSKYLALEARARRVPLLLLCALSRAPTHPTRSILRRPGSKLSFQVLKGFNPFTVRCDFKGNTRPPQDNRALSAERRSLSGRAPACSPGGRRLLASDETLGRSGTLRRRTDEHTPATITSCTGKKTLP